MFFLQMTVKGELTELSDDGDEDGDGDDHSLSLSLSQSVAFCESFLMNSLIDSYH